MITDHINISNTYMAGLHTINGGQAKGELIFVSKGVGLLIQYIRSEPNCTSSKKNSQGGSDHNTSTDEGTVPLNLMYDNDTNSRGQGGSRLVLTEKKLHSLNRKSLKLIVNTYKISNLWFFLFLRLKRAPKQANQNSLILIIFSQSELSLGFIRSFITQKNARPRKEFLSYHGADIRKPKRLKKVPENLKFILKTRSKIGKI